MQAELVPIVNQIKLEMVSYARELNDIKKNCFGRVRNWEPYFNEGMFRLILLIPKLRALENASKRVQDALEEWTISDFHEYARRTSNVINPKTMCATNRELGALEKVFRDSDILPALAKIRIVEREIRRLAFNKCCELPYLAGHTESIRELALKTLGDSTGTRWDEDAALQLLKVLRQLEALSRA